MYDDYVFTALLNILFALETTHLLKMDRRSVVKNYFNHHSFASLELKTVFIFNQSFCYTHDDETAYILCSQWCQETMIIKTLDQQAYD